MKRKKIKKYAIGGNPPPIVYPIIENPKKFQTGGHGYEDLFNTYISLLENQSFINDEEYKQDDLDSEVDDYINSLYELEQPDFSALDELEQELNSKLEQLENTIISFSNPNLFNTQLREKYNYSGMGNWDEIKHKQMMVESAGNPNAIGPKTKYGNAKGAFQFIDATWERYKPYPNASPFDIKAASIARDRYMNDLLNRYNGDMRKALAAYNWGEGNIDKNIKQYGNDWDKHLPKETSNYLKKIVGYQYGGNTSEGHGYEDIFNSYLNMLESSINGISNDIPQEQPTLEDEVNEYISTLTSEEDSENNSNFVQYYTELLNTYNERLEKLQNIISGFGISGNEIINFSNDYYNGSYNDENRVFSLTDPGLNPNIKPLFDHYSKVYGVGNLGTYPSEEHLKQNPNSDHNTGDAIDLEVPGPRPDIAEQLVKEAKERNIKYIIHNGKIWSQKKANQGWRPYKGSNPHKGHIHVSFNR